MGNNENKYSDNILILMTITLNHYNYLLIILLDHCLTAVQ